MAGAGTRRGCRCRRSRAAAPRWAGRPAQPLRDPGGQLSAIASAATCPGQTTGVYTELEDADGNAAPARPVTVSRASLPEIRAQRPSAATSARRRLRRLRRVGDLQAPLLALDASGPLRRKGGEKTEPLEDFLADGEGRLLLDVSYEEAQRQAATRPSGGPTPITTRSSRSAAAKRGGELSASPRSQAPGHAERAVPRRAGAPAGRRP